MAEQTLHIGRKISRIRELKGMKQEALAQELGVSQQTVSNIENNQQIEDEVLAKIAKALGVTPEAVKNFSEEAVMNFFNTFNDSSINQGPLTNYGTINFNPLDKLIEVFEENKRLYERLLQAEKEKHEILNKH